MSLLADPQVAVVPWMQILNVSGLGQTLRRQQTLASAFAPALARLVDPPAD